MIRNVLTTILAGLVALTAMAQQPAHHQRVAAYIEQYKSLAMAEQRRSGIPAAITLGQGILETEAGRSELATFANNHFGIKCKKEWAGETFNHDDDAPQECFRKYPSAAQSYRDHSDYLRTAKRYAPCFALDGADYAGWARALRRCGYATNPKYAQILIKIIEENRLQEYTYAAVQSAEMPVLLASAGLDDAAAVMMAEEKPKPGEVVPHHDDTPSGGDAPVYGQLVKKDGAKGFWAHKGDVLLEYAIQYKVRYARILEINGLPDAPLAQDGFVYIEKGGAVDAVLGKDYSAPAPAVVAPVQSPAAAAVPAMEEKSASVDELSAATPAAVGEPKSVATRVAVAVEPVAAPVAVAPAVAPVDAMHEPIAAEQPMDEFSKLKARLDRAVYATPQKPQPARVSAPEAHVAPPLQAMASATKKYHTVAPGETMFGIAKAAGIGTKELMALNGMATIEGIKVGQKLRVK